MNKKIKVVESIPQGIYCYDDDGVCPFWSIRKDKPEQENGYCSFLKKGDWDFNYCSLLWNKVKECDKFLEENEFNLSCGNKYYENIKRFLKKLSLWYTIPKVYGFWEKFIKYIIKGKICRCKFCKKYFLTSTESLNETGCYSCWLMKIREKRRKVDE
jgi:hypothetical protein